MKQDIVSPFFDAQCLYSYLCYHPFISLFYSDDEEYKYRNELYTACKLGNIDQVRELLKTFLPSDTAISLQTISITDQPSDGCSPQSSINAPDSATCASNEGAVHTDTSNSLSGSGIGNKPCLKAGHEGMMNSGLISEPFGEARRTLLSVAATQNHREIVGMLLEAGADPTFRYGVMF